MNSYELLTGVGTLYVASLGETFPLVDAVPSVNWINLGNTIDGVTINVEQENEEIFVDQETGPVKAVRTTEGITISTNLAVSTLENLAQVLSQTITTVNPGVGVIGTKSIGLYRGVSVTEKAFLFRGSSPYGASFPAQYQLTRGYFAGETESEFVKDGVAQIPVEFRVLVDLTQGTEALKFGKLIVKSAAALP